MKYRNKPKIVEATQWFPEIGAAIQGVERKTTLSGGLFIDQDTGKEVWFVTTIHGQKAYLSPGDYVITEPDGVHHYPCKPDIFEQCYEPL